MNISIPYQGEKHRKVYEALRRRKRMWNNDTSDQRLKWKEDQRDFYQFVNESDDDQLRRNKANNSGKPEYTQIAIPYSYGLLMAFHTYLSSVFLARTPVLQFQERHGASETSVQAIESVMDYQTSVGKHLAPYYIWLMDASKNGLGVIGTYWENERVQVSKIVEEVPTFGPFTLPGATTRKVKRTVEIDGYKGNRIYNIRPHDFIFDTRVSLANFQQGEFAGRIMDISWLDITDGAERGLYIKSNVEKLKTKAGNKAKDFDEHRDEDEEIIDLPSRGLDDHASNESTVYDIPETGRLEGFEMVVRLVPRNWGLGDSKRTEKWVFTVVNEVIIGAKPLGELHDKYPYSILETEVDGHALFGRSMLQIAKPMNDVLDWLINTHFFNIRKTLNNMFVADPSRIYTKDFKNPEEGLMIRMRPEAYGQPINTMIQQFQTSDVTGTHIRDIEVITRLMQLTLGVNDQLMGLLEPRGRRTATEVRGSTGFSMNRLKTQAEYMSALGFAPHSEMMVQSTQQHLDIERYYRLTGDLLPGQDPSILVNPESIVGFYDYIPVDGTMPVDKLALANLWKEIMAGVMSSEQLMMQYDIGKIFAYTAQLAGAKNVNRFKTQLMPDDVIARERARGNLVPLGDTSRGTEPVPGPDTAFRSSRAAESGRLEDTAARVNEPSQLSGVGPVS